MKLLFDRLTSTIGHHLDLRLERGNILTANLANADTPGYTPVELKFDEALAKHLENRDAPGMRRTSVEHRGSLNGVPEGEMEFDFFSLADESGNSVDLDHEMSKLAENQLLYQAMTRVYSKRMALVKYAIAEGST